MADRAQTAPVLTVLNLKGGVGKTHASWLLAGVAQEREQRVLLVDLDTQANLTSSFLDDVDLPATVATIFDPSAEPAATALVRRTPFSHVDLLPSAAGLAAFDESKQEAWERTDGHFALVEPLTALRQHYDLIVFDCPPRLSLVSFAALCASDGVIVPLEAADWGAQGILRVAKAIDYVRERFNPRLELLGYLISRYKRSRSFQRTYLAALRKHFGAAVFDTVIPDLAEFEKSVTDRIPITLRAPKDPAAEIARRFFDEVCRRAAARPAGAQSVPAQSQPRQRAVAAAR